MKKTYKKPMLTILHIYKADVLSTSPQTDVIDFNPSWIELDLG